jgi:hypothetical protein
LKRRRTEIRIERREISIVRTKSQAGLHCQVCGKDLALVSIDEAAMAWGMEAETLRRWLQEGRIHGCTTSDGRLVLCAESLREVV